MSLKNQIKTDTEFFLNIAEFADTAFYNGKEISVLFDTVAEENFLIEIITCNKEDLDPLTTSTKFILNGKTYTASSWVDRAGMMEIVVNVQN